MRVGSWVATWETEKDRGIRSSDHGFNIIYLDRKLETLVAFFKDQDVIKHLSIYNRYVCFNAISKYLHDVHNISQTMHRRGYESSPFCKLFPQCPETINIYYYFVRLITWQDIILIYNKNPLMSVCVPVCSLWTPKPFCRSSPNLAWAKRDILRVKYA